MHRKMVRIWIICSVATSLSLIAGLIPSCKIGFFQKHDIHGYYSNSENTKIVDDIWIHPIVQGTKSYFAFPPLFVSDSEKAPYKMGLMFVDYENKNKCRSVEITEFIVVHNGNKHYILKNGSKEFYSFQTYVEGVSHVKLECLFNAGDWLTTENENAIDLIVKFKIRKESGSIESEFRGKVNSTVIEGYGTMLGILSA
jgi:hypothetical protein